MFPQPLSDTIVLDFFSENDAQAHFEVINHNREHLKEFLPWLDLATSLEDSHAFIKKITSDNTNQKSLTLCIRELERLIGVISFHAFDTNNHSAGIGYWLDYRYQGRGIMTASCATLIDYGFDHVKLQQIKISCNTANAKSIALAERLGFTRRVFIPQKEWLYDHFVDHYCYDVTAEEWAQLKRTKPNETANLFVRNDF